MNYFGLVIAVFVAGGCQEDKEHTIISAPDASVVDASQLVDGALWDASSVDAPPADASPDVPLPAIGYFKPNDSHSIGFFGGAMDLSEDGKIMVVGANYAMIDDDDIRPGAVYVFEGSNELWGQRAVLRASNPDHEDFFGFSLSLSGDGNTLAVGAPLEDGGATAINGDEGLVRSDVGAVYVFVREQDGTWVQQAYVKRSNLDGTDLRGFGRSVSLSHDGNTLTGSGGGGVSVFFRSAGEWSEEAALTSGYPRGGGFGASVSLSGNGQLLAIGAPNDSYIATGINPKSVVEGETPRGSVYIFARASSTWNQEAYIRTSHIRSGHFGFSIALNATGSVLLVGAEDNSLGTEAENGGFYDSGAAHVFSRNNGMWSDTAYLKASNLSTMYGEAHFGHSVSISTDGTQALIGAPQESSNGVGIDGDQTLNPLTQTGAAYQFSSVDGVWSQTRYLKASNPGDTDYFGNSVVISGDGNHVAVGAENEASAATVIGGDANDDSLWGAGAVYLY